MSSRVSLQSLFPEVLIQDALGAPMVSRAELEEARREAAIARAALEALAARVSLRRPRRLGARRATPAEGETAPPKVDDVLRARARRALKRGGFVPGGGSR